MDDQKLKLNMNSGLSVLSAFVNWRGAALALNYQMELEAKRGNIKENQWNIRKVLSMLKGEFGKDENLVINVNKKIPSGMGLKSSSALVSAIVTTYSLMNELNLDTEKIVQISSKISRGIRISATGASDDLYASLLGGLCITDNRKSLLIKRYIVKEKHYIIIIPDKKKSSFEMGKVDIGFLRNTYDRMFQRLNSYNYEDIAVMNGFYLSSVTESFLPGDVLRGLHFVKSGINGKGPSIFLQYENIKLRERDLEILNTKNVKTLVASSSNEKSTYEWKNE
jgi:shikimate kinase